MINSPTITSTALIRLRKKKGSKRLVKSVVVARHPSVTETFEIFIAPKKVIQ
jgi:hypothetical protein